MIQEPLVCSDTRTGRAEGKEGKGKTCKEHGHGWDVLYPCKDFHNTAHAGDVHILYKHTCTHAALGGRTHRDALLQAQTLQNALSKRRAKQPGAPVERGCVRNLPGASVTLMSCAPPRLALKS